MVDDERRDERGDVMQSEGDRSTATGGGAQPVAIPIDALSEAALAGIIDAFVLREGTDYGAREATHEAKVAQVRRQLVNGAAVIVFDASTESVTLVATAEWQARLDKGE